MNTKVLFKSESDDQREKYTPPTITTLGKIEDLTHGPGAPSVLDTVLLGTQ